MENVLPHINKKIIRSHESDKNLYFYSNQYGKHKPCNLKHRAAVGRGRQNKTIEQHNMS